MIVNCMVENMLMRDCDGVRGVDAAGGATVGMLYGSVVWEGWLIAVMESAALLIAVSTEEHHA